MSRLQRAFWSAHSTTWDESLADPTIAGRVDEIADWLASAVPAGATIADLGCGTGNHSLALGERGAEVIGVDSAGGMLDRAARKGVCLVRADLLALPLREHSLAGVLSVYSAQFFQLDAFVASARRLLRPGGALLLVLPHATRARRRAALSLRFRAFQQVKNVLAAIGVRVGRVHLHHPEDVRAALAAAGFRVENERTNERNFAMLANAR